MPWPLNAVAFTAGFLSQAKAEGMTEQELLLLTDMLALNPSVGDLIVGSGGCRKVRFARTGGGKSGGYRVVTFYAPPDRPVYLMAVLSKSDRATFTDGEVAAMARVTKAILAAGRRG